MSFLHQRALSTAIIEGYIAQPRSEDEQLDFKSIPWKAPNGLEAAKDIAAFANQLGGDIILGISDKDDCAAGWIPIPNADLANIGSNIRQWLITYIRPHEFAEVVEIESIPALIPNHSVITVSVPPSPGLVGVERREGDKITLQFPIRIGKRTRWLTFDEVMNRSSFSTRGTYIRLEEMKANFGIGTKPPVSFSNAIYHYLEGAPVLLRPGQHGELIELTDYTVTVGIPSPHDRRYICNLIIPIELIEAAWLYQEVPSQANPYFSLSLSAEIMWDGASWFLITGRSRLFR